MVRHCLGQGSSFGRPPTERSESYLDVRCALIAMSGRFIGVENIVDVSDNKKCNRLNEK
jgi:hypothetical protein